jgi:hypothetical protein
MRCVCQNKSDQRLARLDDAKNKVFRQSPVSSIKAEYLNHNDVVLLKHIILLATLPEPFLPLHRLWRSNGMHARSAAMIRLLATPLPACLNIPPGRTATTQSHLNQPRENCERARNPHEHKQRDANLSANIQFSLPSNSVAEDDEHDGRDDGCYGDDERVEESKNGDGEGEPACEDGEGH